MTDSAPDADVPDAELLTAVARGNHAAFARLVARKQSGVFQLARSLAKDSAVAEEIAQEAFERLYRHAADVRAVGPWLSRTVINLVKDHSRTRMRNEAFLTRTAAQQELEPPPPPDLAIEHAERREQIERVLAELPAELREVLRLRYYADLRYEEVAETLGVPLGTVCTRLRRGLRELGLRLNDNATVRGNA